jgi:hypothetical protein
VRVVPDEGSRQSVTRGVQSMRAKVPPKAEKQCGPRSLLPGFAGNDTRSVWGPHPAQVNDFAGRQFSIPFEAIL